VITCSSSDGRRVFAAHAVGIPKAGLCVAFISSVLVVGNMIVVAAQEDGEGIGRIRLKHIKDASADSLVRFVKESIEPGSVVHTDSWTGYFPLDAKGYVHEVSFLRGNKKTPSELLPRVHRVVSLLKRWLMGTHQGAVRHAYLDYYLDEFTFRFNRRTSKSRGHLFYRLAQQAVVVNAVAYEQLVKQARESLKHKM